MSRNRVVAPVALIRGMPDKLLSFVLPRVPELLADNGLERLLVFGPILAREVGGLLTRDLLQGFRDSVARRPVSTPGLCLRPEPAHSIPVAPDTRPVDVVSVGKGWLKLVPAWWSLQPNERLLYANALTCVAKASSARVSDFVGKLVVRLQRLPHCCGGPAPRLRSTLLKRPS